MAMPERSIRKLCWGCVPPHAAPAWGSAESALLAILPAPHSPDECLRVAGFAELAELDDAWDAEWREIVERTVGWLEAYGSSRMPQPVEVREVQSRSLLDRLLGRTPSKPVDLSVVDQVILLTEDDQSSPAVVEFGEPTTASLRACDGHAILWISTSPEADLDRHAMLAGIAGDRPIEKIDLAWDRLIGPPGDCHN